MSDPTDGHWEERTAMPARNHDMRCLAHDGALLAVGGFNHEENFDAVEAYDPADDDWSGGREPMPTARGLYGGATVDGDYYVAGGQRLHADYLSGDAGLKYQVFDDLERYDPAADEWTALASMSRRRAGLGAVGHRGRFYALGGIRCEDVETFPDGDVTDLIEVYHPGRDAWEAAPPLPEPRLGAAVERLDGRVFVVGGSDGGAVQDTVYAGDPASGEWSTVASLEVPRRDHVSVVRDGRLYVVGGLSERGGDGPAFTGVCEVYDPGADRWTRRPAHPVPKAWAGAGVVDGRLFVVGGADSSGEEVTFYDDVHELVTDE